MLKGTCLKRKIYSKSGKLITVTPSSLHITRSPEFHVMEKFCVQFDKFRLRDEFFVRQNSAHLCIYTYIFVTFQIVCAYAAERRRQRVNEESLSRRCASFCSLHPRYELGRRHFNGCIIVDCRASKYTLIPYVSYNGHRVPVSPRLTATYQCRAID